MPSPERIRWAQLRIAIVTMTALSILFVLVYLLSGGTWLQPKSYLTTHIPDATGVAPEADVQLNGVRIGTVESVRLTHSLDPNRVVEVRMKVEAAYLPYIPEDSITTIDSANLVGDKYIDINMGKSPRPVHPGSDLHYPPPAISMQNIDLRQFDAQLRTIDQILRDIQSGKGPLGQFVVSDALYRQFLDGIEQVERKLRAATSSQSQLGQMLYNSTLHDKLSESLRQLDDRLAKVQSNPLLRDSAQYDQIRGQLVSLHRTLADLNAGTGAGSDWLASDATYRQWNRLISTWIGNLDALNSGQGAMGQMLSNAQTYESLNGQLQHLQSTIREFRQDPQKYLRIKFKF